MSRLFTAAGVRCGHELACEPTGFKGFGEAQGDASWFAAPYLSRLPEDVVVIHQLRHPVPVARSWYRIGLFSGTPFRSVCYGRVAVRQCVENLAAPRRFLKRWLYITDQRRLVLNATDVFDIADEAQRCFRYWVQWNRLVEECSTGRAVYRFRIEDLGPTTWNSLAEFLDADLGTLPELPSANRKNRYPPRTFPPVPVPPDVQALATKYGYDTADASPPHAD